jgi:hypothetical protein
MIKTISLYSHREELLLVAKSTAARIFHRT